MRLNHSQPLPSPNPIYVSPPQDVTLFLSPVSIRPRGAASGLETCVLSHVEELATMSLYRLISSSACMLQGFILL